MRSDEAACEASHNEPRRVEALAYVAWLELERGDINAAFTCVSAGLPAARVIGHHRAMYLFFGTGSRANQLRGQYALAEAMNLEALPMTMEVNGRVDCLFGWPWPAPPRADIGRARLARGGARSGAAGGAHGAAAPPACAAV